MIVWVGLVLNRTIVDWLSLIVLLTANNSPFQDFTFTFSFSWELKWPQEKLKTMLMQYFGVTNKEHYGMLWYFLQWSLAEFLHPYNDDLPENRQLFSKRTERKENNVCVQANVFDSLWMFTCWAFDWNNKQTEKLFLLINRRGKTQSSVPTQSCSKASKYFDNWTSPSTQYNISARVFPELSFE